MSPNAAANGCVDITGPSIVGDAVSNADGTQLTLTFNEDLAAANNNILVSSGNNALIKVVDSAGQKNVRNAVSASIGTDSKELTFNIADALIHGRTYTVTIETGTGLKDATGNDIQTKTGIVVSNTVPASTSCDAGKALFGGICVDCEVNDKKGEKTAIELDAGQYCPGGDNAQRTNCPADQYRDADDAQVNACRLCNSLPGTKTAGTEGALGQASTGCKATECEDHYNLNDGSCAANQCVCDKGKSVTDPDGDGEHAPSQSCTENGANVCTEVGCFPGYGYIASSKSCAENVCSCSNGKSVTDPEGDGTHVHSASCSSNNANVCNSCDADYVLDGTTCKLCKNTDGKDLAANALTVQKNNNDGSCDAVTCSSPYIVSGGDCVACSGIDNAVEYTSNGVDTCTLKECASGFYMNGNTCVACSGEDNAIEYSSDGKDLDKCKATKCTSGYIETNDKCVACSGIDNAVEYTSDGVSTCAATKCSTSGYYLSSGACTACNKDNAASHTSDGVNQASCGIHQCKLNFELVGTGNAAACLACVRDGAAASGTDAVGKTCEDTKCHAGYYLSDKACIACDADDSVQQATSPANNAGGLDSCTIVLCANGYEISEAGGSYANNNRCINNGQEICNGAPDLSNSNIQSVDCNGAKKAGDSCTVTPKSGYKGGTVTCQSTTEYKVTPASRICPVSKYYKSDNNHGGQNACNNGENQDNCCVLITNCGTWLDGSSGVQTPAQAAQDAACKTCDASVNAYLDADNFCKCESRATSTTKYAFPVILSGATPDKTQCVKCSPGSYIAENGHCTFCDDGQYSTEVGVPGENKCQACAGISNVAVYGSHMGRNSASDCYVEKCNTGFYKNNPVNFKYQGCVECSYDAVADGGNHAYGGGNNNCPAGKAVTVCDGTTTSDTSDCVDCVAGSTYSSKQNSASCEVCSMCASGYIPAYACQKAFNTGTCSLCLDSTYRLGTTATQTSCTACDIANSNAATYSTSEASGRNALTDCTIASCAPTYYLSNGECKLCSGACDSSVNGLFQTLNVACSATADRTCKGCGECDAGFKVSNVCTATSETQCAICPEGKYREAGTNGHLFDSCTACTTDEVANAVEFTNQGYNAVDRDAAVHASATKCKAKTCAANHYLDDGACVACTSVSTGATTATADQGTLQASVCKVTACEAGKYLDATARNGKGACVACQFTTNDGADGLLVAGKYCPAGSTSPAGSDCPAGQYNGADSDKGDVVDKCRPCEQAVAGTNYVTAVCTISSNTQTAACTTNACDGWETRDTCHAGKATGNDATTGSDGVCRHNNDHCDYELGIGNLNDNVRATTAAANNMVSIASGADSSEQKGDTLSHVCLEGFTGGSVTCSEAGKNANSAGYTIVACTKVCEEGVKYYDKTNDGCGSGNVNDQSCCDACQGPSAGFYTTVICSEKANTITTAACKICASDEYLTKVCVPGSNTQVGEISTCDDCTVCSGDGKTENVKCVSTGTVDTTCKDCGQCTKGQFVKTACTDTSDTVCDECGEGTYQNADISSSVAKQGTTTCTACTEADGTSLNAHTFTNDGYTDGSSNLPHIQASKCRAKTCKKGFQLKRNDAKQSLGECEACPAGTYQEVDGGVNCVACPAGSVTNTLTNTGAHQCTICPAGTFSTDSSRACQACTGSTYLSDDGQDTTKHDHADDCTKCPAGTQNTEVGAAAHNDVSDCKVCPRGMYNAVEGGNCGNCPAGTFLSDGTALVGTDASKHDHLDDCDDCPNGGFSSAGAHECSTHTQCGKQTDVSSRLSSHSSTEAGSCDACDAGSYDPDGLETTDENYKGNQDCVPHEVCGNQLAKDAEGNVVSRLTGASAISKGSCADCADGTYAANGEANCAAHTVCGNQLAKDAGGNDVSRLSFASEAAKKTTAGSCDVCADNTYAPSSTDNCLPNQVCGLQVGNVPRLTGATRTSKGSCIACTAGTFDNSVNNDQTCSSHHQCEKGEYVTDAGSATRDRTCATCGVHTYSDAVNSASCTNCPVGSENLDAGQSAAAHDDVSDCSICVAGEYSNAGSACVGCPKGTFNNADNSAAANHAGIASCTICLAHQYADTVGSTACTACSSTTGDNPNQNGGQACTDALCGGNNGFANANGVEQCTACVAGKYGPVGQPCQDCQNDFSFFKAGDGTVLVTATTTVPGATSKEECSATACIPGARLTGASPNRCEKILCAVNQYVENNVCKDCSYSRWAPAGSDPAGADTTCFSGGNGVGDSSLPDQQGIEAINPESGYEQKVIYSHVGSLHVNKYGYLVDLNGLLLIGKATDGTTDENAKHHIHVPSRYNNVYFSQDGKAWVMELDGGHFQHVGTIMLARFENPLGLNKFRKITTYCIPESNEFGFMLGNWCENTWLDEYETQYMSESILSGPGIVASPHSQGMGRIANGRSHRVSKEYRNIFATAPGWNLVVQGRGYFQYRYIMAKIDRDSWKNDPSSHGDGSYDAAYKTTNAGEGHI